MQPFCRSGAQTENSQSPFANRLAPIGIRLSEFVDLIIHRSQVLIHLIVTPDHIVVYSDL